MKRRIYGMVPLAVAVVGVFSGKASDRRPGPQPFFGRIDAELNNFNGCVAAVRGFQWIGSGWHYLFVLRWRPLRSCVSGQ
jgi:hypothetical protein